jgi:uncharacterized protein (DUF885 family)
MKSMERFERPWLFFLAAAAVIQANPCLAGPVPDEPLGDPNQETVVREPLDPALPVMTGMIERYVADLALLRRFEDAPLSKRGVDREQEFFREWLARTDAVDPDALEFDGRVDLALFRNQLQFELKGVEHERARRAEMGALVPFAPAIVALHEGQRDLAPVDPSAAAAALDELDREVGRVQRRIAEELARPAAEGAERPVYLKQTVANRAAGSVDLLQRALREWFNFYNEYDPMFTWWAAAPWRKVDQSLGEYAKFLREKVAGVTDPNAIIGDPIGRDALIDMLEYEMIAYTPEELVEIANEEYAWCLREMLKASEELGFGDNWRAALEHVKDQHVSPGEQPALIATLAQEAIDFIEERDLVTVPDLCKSSWRMEMMSPARQKVSPFFLGGEAILIAFPTAGMSQDEKIMALRSNNIHFSRATVQHELIPGHHLQGFMMDRYRTHRALFNTPFWLEGWALYWEMRLWDLGFPQSPENRIGMLFWRMHRCARIIFSLSFHLETMSPQECIEYLVENVGHERSTAEAEVRRSVSGDYGPLYQAAYMLGGLQFRALHEDLVKSGRMTEKAFHDMILQNNSIPVEMVRAILTENAPGRNFRARWRFYEEVD